MFDECFQVFDRLVKLLVIRLLAILFGLKNSLELHMHLSNDSKVLLRFGGSLVVLVLPVIEVFVFSFELFSVLELNRNVIDLDLRRLWFPVVSRFENGLLVLLVGEFDFFHR